jgi:type II secretory pathway component PulJ
MTRARRWLTLEPRRSEQGVTFVELIISVVLLSMVTGGLASAFVTSLNGSGPAQARVREANDAQVIAGFLVRDAQAAGGTDPGTGQPDPTLGVSTATDFGCGGGGPPVLGFKWNDRVSPLVQRPHVANYYLQNGRVVRTTCVDNGAPSTLSLANNIARVTAACTPTGTGCSGLPQTVSLTVTSSHNTVTSPTTYTYTLTASVRPEGQAAPTDDTARVFPLVALGSGGYCAGAPVLSVTGSAAVRTFGNVVVNAADATNGTCRAMEQDSVNYQPAETWILQHGSCWSIASPNQCPRGQELTVYDTPFPDPYAETQWYTACNSGAGNPSNGPNFPRAVYHNHVTITRDATFDDGTSVFCQGVTVSGTAHVLGSNPRNPDVRWYAPNSQVTIAGHPTVSVKSIVARTMSFANSAAVNIGTPPPAPLTITEPPGDTLPNWTVNVPYPAGVTIVATGGFGPHAWRADGLPRGLAIDPQTGTISGTPQEIGGFTVKVSAYDSLGDVGPKTFGLTINKPPNITLPRLPDWTRDRDYRDTVMTADGGTTPYTWSATGLPSGLSIAADTGVITGTPTVTGVSTVVVTMVDKAGVSTSKTYDNVTINDPPEIRGPAGLPEWTRAVPYPNQTMSAANGTLPYKWVASGLPDGLSLDQASGVLSGIPLADGDFAVKVTLTDASGASVTAQYALRIDPLPTIITTDLPNWVQNAPRPYDFTLSAGGRPRAWTWTAAGLPPGLSLDPPSGRITGVPTTAGPWTPVITLRDGTGASTSKAYSLTINSPPSIPAPANLQDWTINRDYPGTQIVVNDGLSPFTWQATGLPAGLSINSRGVITGTPTTSGTFNVTVTATDPTGSTASRTYSLVINPSPVITTASLPNAEQGVAYATTVNVANGTAPFTWFGSGLPTGIVIDPATGRLSGTPSVSGAFQVTITAVDAAGASAPKILTLNIAPPPSVGTDPLPDWTINRVYPNTTVTASGGTAPFTWSASGLPSGLSINPTNGTVTGTPNLPGISAVTVTITDANGAVATQNFTVKINDPPLITTLALPAGQVGDPYSATVSETGGTSPMSWSATGLPAGLSIVSGTGEIQGTPTATGTSAITVTATDAAGASATMPLALVITPGALVSSTSPSALGQGATNRTVAVNGSGFVNGSSLSVVFSGGGVAVNSTAYVSSNQVNVDVTVGTGAAPGARDVVLTNGNGSTATGSGKFTVNAAPTVASVTPATRNTPGASVVISGSGFAVPGATVAFAGAGAPGVTNTVVNDAGTITVTMNTNGAGSYDVVVTNSDGGQGTLPGGLTVT